MSPKCIRDEMQLIEEQKGRMVLLVQSEEIRMAHNYDLQHDPTWVALVRVLWAQIREFY